jgi:purine-binding chemotaxis protein CheW
MARRPLATEATFLAAYRERRSRQHYDREVLSFRLANETYGIEMRWLREIHKVRPMTEVPRVPAFLPGIISVRGAVVPVLDMRRRIGLAVEPLGRPSRILIVEHEEERFGLIVDEVHKVVRLLNAQVESAPLPGGIDSAYLSGVARSNGEMIVLLDVPAVVSFSLEEGGARE